MRLRQTEVDAVLEALDREYDTDREAATVIYNVVVDLLALRESYVVGARFGPSDSSMMLGGPYWDLRSAKRGAGNLVGEGLLAVPLRVYPVRPPEGEALNSRCSDCAHAVAAHAVTTKSGRGKLRCFVRGCQPCAPRWPPPRGGG